MMLMPYECETPVFLDHVGVAEAEDDEEVDDVAADEDGHVEHQDALEALDDDHGEDVGKRSQHVPQHQRYGQEQGANLEP